MSNVSNELSVAVRRRTIWVDLDALSAEINSLNLVYDRLKGQRFFESPTFTIWVETNPMRAWADETIKIAPLINGEAYFLGELRVPRFCRLWVYFFGDREVSYAVMNPWDEGTALGRRMDLYVFDPMRIWTTVVHSLRNCKCCNPQQYQQDYSPEILWDNPTTVPGAENASR